MGSKNREITELKQITTKGARDAWQHIKILNEYAREYSYNELDTFIDDIVKIATGERLKNDVREIRKFY